LSDEKSTGWPPEADSVDRRGRLDDVASVDDRFWDKATIAGKTPVTQFDGCEVLVSPSATC
jgi:hypothetical protein